MAAEATEANTGHEGTKVLFTVISAHLFKQDNAARLFRMSPRRRKRSFYKQGRMGADLRKRAGHDRNNRQ
jgi:hypothetical protein